MRRGDGARLSFLVMGRECGQVHLWCVWPRCPHARAASRCFLLCFHKTRSSFLGEFMCFMSADNDENAELGKQGTWNSTGCLRVTFTSLGP